MNAGFVVNGEDVISARGFAREIDKAINTVMKGIKEGAFMPQMIGKDPITKKRVIGFREEYAAEVKKVLPKEVVSGSTLFSPSVLEALHKINKRWLGKKVKW